MDMIRIAIVEDNKDISELMQLIISTADDMDCIHVFSSAEDALELLPEDAMDVVLMDINLPGINGIECVKRLLENSKGKNHSTQFLMCTVYQDDENIFEALKAGATGYIVKKTPADKLLNAIRELHEGGSPMSPSIARKILMSFKNPPIQKMNASAEILTEREKELLQLLSQGLFYKEIADKLNIALITVKKHCNNIYRKLQVSSRTEAVNKVFKR